jgi:3-deoxy-D-manno-octulosonate 8-phosphate phosphatase (KDO 8-P phosphatase)
MNLSPDVIDKARRIKALILDVDGVLTDGGMYVTSSGERFKRFDVRDGLGLVSLIKHGYRVALISSDPSEEAAHRARHLGIPDAYTGVASKVDTLNEVLQKHGLKEEEVAFVGDDLGDLEVMRKVGLAICVADAAPRVRAAAQWVTERAGGRGAVREICDALLELR